MIIKIIEKFLGPEGLTKTLYQREFVKILNDLSVKILPQMAVAFLVKKGVIEIKGIKHTPQVVLSNKAHLIIAERKALQEQIELTAEKDKRQKALLEFPGKALKTLTRLGLMLSKQRFLDNAREEKRVALARLDELKAEVKAVEERIALIEKEERRFIADIEQVLGKIKPELLTVLIDLAQKPTE